MERMAVPMEKNEARKNHVEYSMTHVEEVSSISIGDASNDELERNEENKNENFRISFLNRHDTKDSGGV